MARVPPKDLPSLEGATHLTTPFAFSRAPRGLEDLPSLEERVFLVDPPKTRRSLIHSKFATIDDSEITRRAAAEVVARVEVLVPIFAPSVPDDVSCYQRVRTYCYQRARMRVASGASSA